MIVFRWALFALLLGAIVELAVIRRFFRAPRLILTVASGEGAFALSASASPAQRTPATCSSSRRSCAPNWSVGMRWWR